MFNKTPPKGMRDFLPDEVEFRNALMEKIKQSYYSFGFRQIETPCVEDLALLTSKQGGDNEKLLYKILKRGEKLEKSEGELADLGLRFDLTLPLARYYCNNIANLPTVVKATNIGNVFRAERNQRGRYRQLIQCDIDILNEGTILAEIELILASKATFEAIGFGGNCDILINDRKILSELAKYCGFDSQNCDKMFISLDKLDKIGMKGVCDELSQWADSSCIDKLMQTLDQIKNSPNQLVQCGLILCDAKPHIDNLTKIIEATGAVFDITLVRGMNYYTGTIFEAHIKDENFALGGGGRYDNLIEKIGGIHTPACGFSIGFERVALLLSEREKYKSNLLTALLISKEDLADIQYIYSLANSLRSQGACSLFIKAKNVRYQVESLLANGYKRVLTYNANSKTFEEK